MDRHCTAGKVQVMTELFVKLLLGCKTVVAVEMTDHLLPALILPNLSISVHCLPLAPIDLVDSLFNVCTR